MTNSDFDGKEIDGACIVPGAVLVLQMLIKVASGDTKLLEHWRKARKKTSAVLLKALREMCHFRRGPGA